MLPRLLLVLLLLVPLAAAQEVPDVNETVADSESTLDKIVEGAGDTVDGIGDAVSDAGQGIRDAAGAIGGALAAATRAIAQGVVTITTGFVATGGLLAGGLATGALAVAGGLFSASTWLGLAIGGSTVFLAVALYHGLAATAHTALRGVLGYVGMVGALQPPAMPREAYVAVATTGAAATTATGGWLGWQVLRKWGLAGSLPLLGGFSRIQDSALLEHPLRSEIFSMIRESPGIHASQLARETGAGWGTVTHHLDKLQKGSLVTTRRVNNQKCFFEQGGEVSRQDMAIASALKGDTAGLVASYVGSHPMTSQKQMAESLDISPALASFHVKKLVNLGVLEKIRHGKQTLLTTSEAMRRLVASKDAPLAAAAPETGVGLGA